MYCTLDFRDHHLLPLRCFRLLRGFGSRALPISRRAYIRDLGEAALGDCEGDNGGQRSTIRMKPKLLGFQQNTLSKASLVTSRCEPSSMCALCFEVMV